MIALLLALAAPTLSYQLSASIGVTHVQKVIAMMNEMKAKGTAEMERRQSSSGNTCHGAM